ncbi:MAG: cupin domain-containing protein [Sphingobacteriales bacterium]|nr:MAG: cupin domain-containing protein [Sphingobacteriales bacterium]
MKILSEIEPKEIIKGYTARFVHTDCITIAFWEVKIGAVLPSHSHLHEQTTQVLEGKFELTVDGKTEVYEPGMIAVIPSNVVHGGKALTFCKLMDVFCPVREDYQ